MSALAVIPARGGSKRIPRKNIKNFCGKPIINYSIEAALNAMIFDEVMVSTEDEEIAEIAENAGAKIPFMRSSENADDFATTPDVLKEVVGMYREQGKVFDYICCLYPTAPFVTSSKLVEAHDVLLKSDAAVVVPVVQFSYPIQRSVRIVDGSLEMLWPENYTARSQDLEPVFHDAGQFYFFKYEALMHDTCLFSVKSSSIVVSKMEVQDIDNFDDWELAELKYKHNCK